MGIDRHRWLAFGVLLGDLSDEERDKLEDKCFAMRATGICGLTVVDYGCMMTGKHLGIALVERCSERFFDDDDFTVEPIDICAAEHELKALAQMAELAPGKEPRWYFLNYVF